MELSFHLHEALLTLLCSNQHRGGRERTTATTATGRRRTTRYHSTGARSRCVGHHRNRRESRRRRGWTFAAYHQLGHTFGQLLGDRLWSGPHGGATVGCDAHIHTAALVLSVQCTAGLHHAGGLLGEAVEHVAIGTEETVVAARVLQVAIVEHALADPIHRLTIRVEELLQPLGGVKAAHAVLVGLECATALRLHRNTKGGICHGGDDIAHLALTHLCVYTQRGALALHWRGAQRWRILQCVGDRLMKLCPVAGAHTSTSAATRRRHRCVA
mmetsp:Transcript_12183/g.30869  ORF Transcript_12183/g.30869 Transcript_12183/m.30869 type:complete len:271 (+) Transcript_12183:5981-6793(+)